MRVSNVVGIGLIIAIAAVAWPLISAQSEPATEIAPPKVDVVLPVAGGPQGAARSEGLQTAVLAGGCFWGVQAVFQHTKGVKNAVSGYAGGAAKDADYRIVSAGRSTHAEAVQITFDPREVSYGQLLHIFFSVAHNPTEVNRQGPDVGPQYRSEIFAQNAEQAKVARAYMAQLDAAKVFKRPIATKVGENGDFFRAETYHQDYAHRNPRQPYIVFNDAPKVAALKRMFPALFRETPMTVAMAEKKGT
jgi:peptide-methionine (S)-S-oxide reductase